MTLSLSRIPGTDERKRREISKAPLFPFVDLIDDLRNLLVDKYFSCTEIEAIMVGMTCTEWYKRIAPRFRFHGIPHAALATSIVDLGHIELLDYLRSLNWMKVGSLT